MAVELVQLTGENQCQKHITEIKRGISNIAIQFVAVGYELYKIKEFKLYKEMGYKNLEEFGIKELNLKSSSIYNFINVCMNFSSKINGYPTILLDQKYLGYGYTQLTEMLALAPAQREEIKKDMSIKEIREVKKNALKSVAPVVIDAVIVPNEVIKLPCDSFDSAVPTSYKAQLRQNESEYINKLLKANVEQENILRDRLSNARKEIEELKSKIVSVAPNEKTFTFSEIKRIFVNNITHSKGLIYNGSDAWQVLDDLLTDTLMDFD